MVMHLAIALVTYNLLVHVAPPRPANPEPGAGARSWERMSKEPRAYSE
jgi:hypothetical protein